MLSLRTKQINTYGRRPKRVIEASSSAASSNRTVSSKGILSIFEDMPSPPPLKNLAAKMKKRENDVSSKPKALSPKVVGGMQRKKRLSPVLSPVKKRQQSRILEIKSQAAGLADDSPAAVVKPTVKKLQAPGRPSNTDGLPASPSRTPLSSVPLNIPGSPALMQRPRYQASNRPLKLQKPLNNLVDVDIIVLDDEGHTVSKERRVSRTNVEVNPINKAITSEKQPSSTLTDSESDDEAEYQPRQKKRRTARHRLVVSSDDSDSDAGHAPSAQVQESHNPPVSSRLAGTSSIVLAPIEPYNVARAAPRSEVVLTKPEIPPLATVDSCLHHPDIVHVVLQDTPSPVLKPRQLTPIRGSRRRQFQPPSPPTPVTDLDLTIDFADLNLGHGCLPGGSDFNAPEYLEPLLEECHQERCGPYNFSTFIETFPYDPILQSARDTTTLDMNFRKIGEASYSEVFGIGDVVLKVIPLRDELRAGRAEEVDGPAPTDAKDVRKEIIVTRAMGEVYTGFTKLLKSYIVRGRYPEVLLQLWDEYNERKGSESVRPDTFKVSQIYAIIVLPNGGPDLEAYTFHNASRSGWRQACSLFWQVAKSLAHAEHLVSFEHRDLHWGQILVKNLPTQNNALKSLNANQRAKPKSPRVYMDDRSHGIQATIIDLGLSRMDAGDGGDGERVYWTPFDKEVFMGEGDYQFDIYRMMKELSGNAWDGFHPITNVLWLHYLLRKLLQSKGLRPPPIPRKTQGSEAPVPPPGDAAFSEKDCYECLGDIENWLGKTIVDLIPSGGKLALKGRKGRRKTQAPLKVTSQLSLGPARAGEIVAYGVKKGWIRPSTLF